MAKNKTVIIVAGPTAVGKTSVAIQIAKQLSTEIISADSRQCYKEMKIGVARPTEDELGAVKHHFIASHSIHQNVNAVTFENYALEKSKEIFSKKDNVVMVGGTGLYIKAFCEGLDLMPEIPIARRNQIIKDYEKNGLEWLQQQVQNIDPEFYEVGEVKNPHRLMRALEIKRATGKSILEYKSGNKKEREFKIKKFALHLPKEQLHSNINFRVDKMIDEGLIDEVKSLLPYRHLQALQTVGYKEVFSYLNNEIDLKTAIESIKQNTRHYAKRQMTWFKKDNEYKWLHPADYVNILNSL